MERTWKNGGEEAELSLRALSEAFSEVMGRAGVTNLAPAQEESSRESIGSEDTPHEVEMIPPKMGGLRLGEAEPPLSDSYGKLPPQSEQTDPVEISPLTILEAILFVGHPDTGSIEPEMAAWVMRNVRPEEIPELVRELNRRYEAAGCPYHIVCQGRGYRMTLRKPYWHFRHRFYARMRETKLSQAAIDVLAIVAYQQPVTAEQVQQLRGKPSGHILAHLVQRQLLRIERAQDGSRKAHYYTTERFLGLFGLESLEDLPKTEDIEKR